MILGQYDTEERALEVFEEIHKAYKGIDVKKVKQLFSDQEFFNIQSGFVYAEKPAIISTINTVYEMPTS